MIMKLIDYKNVNVYQEEQLVLNNVNLQIEEGEFVYITGKVGTGKSSLLKTLSMANCPSAKAKQKSWVMT